ncbi:MAG: hypothetical protein RRA51_02830, partial [Armatimonadota bacterium]|nr:hypothetical protein [Armatimonadota bacterium]
LRRAALQFNSHTTEIFRHGRAVPSGKNHLLLSTHHSLLAAVLPVATRHSLLAVVSARQKPRPPIFRQLLA